MMRFYDHQNLLALHLIKQKQNLPCRFEALSVSETIVAPFDFQHHRVIEHLQHHRLKLWLLPLF